MNLATTAICLLLCAVPAVAEVRLAAVFTDNMVLQRGMPAPVWGAANPGAQVSVEFAGQTKTTNADDSGKWLVKLDPMPASAESRTLRILCIPNSSPAPTDCHPERSEGALKRIDSEVLRSAQNDKESWGLTNVVVGDVWIAAGQSNMEWPLAKDTRAKEELLTAQDTNFRLCNWSFAGQYYFAKPFGKDVLERLTPEKFYRGRWQECSPVSAKEFSAVAYYFGKELRAARKIPVGIVHLAVGGSPTEAWIRRAMLPAELPLDPWCMKRMKENLGDNKARHPFEPGFLWDAGMARLVPLAMRGVIWYQGESNAETDWRVKQHEMLFTTLVTDWRKQFGREFPFLFVQLPQMDRPNWPAFREQQAQLAKTLPNVKMAVTLDIPVDPKNVHPPNKQPFGQRLAKLALEL